MVAPGWETADPDCDVDSQRLTQSHRRRLTMIAGGGLRAGRDPATGDSLGLRLRDEQEKVEQRQVKH